MNLSPCPPLQRPPTQVSDYLPLGSVSPADWEPVQAWHSGALHQAEPDGMGDSCMPACPERQREGVCGGGEQPAGPQRKAGGTKGGKFQHKLNTLPFPPIIVGGPMSLIVSDSFATPQAAAHRAPPSVDLPGNSAGVGAVAFSAMHA